jgi:hypothetical protein
MRSKPKSAPEPSYPPLGTDLSASAGCSAIVRHNLTFCDLVLMPPASRLASYFEHSAREISTQRFLAPLVRAIVGDRSRFAAAFRLELGGRNPIGRKAGRDGCGTGLGELLIVVIITNCVGLSLHFDQISLGGLNQGKRRASSEVPPSAH